MKGKFRPIIEDPVLVTLYEGQLNPYPYPFKHFLEALKKRLGLLLASIDIGIGENGAEPVPIIYYPVSESKVEGLFKLHQQFWRSYPRRAGTKAGDIYTLDQLISTEEFANNSYIQALLAPFGVKNEWVAAVSGPDGVVCLLRLGVAGKEKFTDFHKAFIRQLRPHLEKALQMHMLIRRPVSIINMLTNMANILDIGFFILNGHKQVIQYNEVANRIVRHGNCLSLVNDKILFTKERSYNKIVGEFFDSALLWRYKDFQRATAADQNDHEASDEIPSAVFRIDRDDGAYVDFLAQPVRAFIPYWNETSPHLVVYIVDSNRHIAASEKLVMQLYALTRAEARLAMMLANGFSIADAAESLGLTEGSARTYSKRIYAKMGVNRQAELVQALHKSVISLAKS